VGVEGGLAEVEAGGGPLAEVEGSRRRGTAVWVVKRVLRISACSAGESAANTAYR
jgi:hypothetical protein